MPMKIYKPWIDVEVSVKIIDIHDYADQSSELYVVFLHAFSINFPHDLCVKQVSELLLKKIRTSLS